MNENVRIPETSTREPDAPGRARNWVWIAVIAALALALGAWYYLEPKKQAVTASAAPPLPSVTVSAPLKKDVDVQIGFLGQFSPINRVELRAQVGGTLTEIKFQDGQIVHKGDLLFVIDPRPYEIKLAQANAQLDAANSRLELANAQITRAQSLRRTEAGSQQTVDQTTSELSASKAAVSQAEAGIRDAQLDLEYCQVKAPFTGRVGSRQVSLGGLIAGSRASTSPTTLLATIVSLDPIYLDFDMGEGDFLEFARERARVSGDLADKVAIALSDETKFTRSGNLDFIDNVLNRSSGTIHARATVANPDLFLTPGSFARLRLAVAPPTTTLLLPDEAVLLDQSQHIVLTVAPDGTVVPKPVETGDLRGGLRIIRAGLDADDRVIIDGIVRAAPGAKVSPQNGEIKFDSSEDGQG